MSSIPDSCPATSLAYVGVDPGTSGAVAVLSGLCLTIFDIPTEVITRNRKQRTRVDAERMVELARVITSLSDCHVIIEDVGGLPGQSASAGHSFGRTCGVIECGFVSAGVRPEFVAPGAWKAALNLIGKDKTASRETAMKLFPLYSHLFARAKDDGRAEAALIAYHAREKDNAGIEPAANRGGRVSRGAPGRRAIRPGGVW